MELHFNIESQFTRWVISAGLLSEPFVVCDIGVQGGENRRWHLLGDYLKVHGFDAIKEVIEELREANSGNPNRVYHWLAAGNSDEKRTFYFNEADPCSSSFFSQGRDRFGTTEERIEQPRNVPVCRLDSLLEAREIPLVDFLKVDVEGAEKDVFLGAPKVLSGLLGVETETNFGVSPMYPQGHLPTLHALLSKARMRVFDLNFNRVPRRSFVQAVGRASEDIGKPATFNVLFCRDLIEEADHPENYTAPCNPESVDRIIKAMIVYELHGFSDIALDTAVRFRESLEVRLDLAKVVSLLADPLCRAPGHMPMVKWAEELDAARRRLEEVEREWADRLTEVQAEFDASQRRLQEVERELADRLTEAQAEFDATQRRLEEAQHELQASRQHVSAVERSISWRVTRPLRAVRTVLLR
jgi:FkbM family methyltransferase